MVILLHNIKETASSWKWCGSNALCDWHCHHAQALTWLIGWIWLNGNDSLLVHLFVCHFSCSQCLSCCTKLQGEWQWCTESFVLFRSRLNAYKDCQQHRVHQIEWLKLTAACLLFFIFQVYPVLPIIWMLTEL